MSKVIQVRGVPDDVHAKLVEAAERAGKSLTAYLAEELALVAAERALQTFTDMAIERHPAAPLRQRIWELRHNLTPYGATYVALAEALGATSLLTVDEPLLTASGPRCRIERP